MPEFVYLPAQDGFLDPDRADAAHPQSARALVIPYGLENTVSYGGGTRHGPTAILAASQQLETFDEELWCCPSESYGIATLRPSAIPENQEMALDNLSKIIGHALDENRFPLTLGGEHGLTPGAVRPFARRFDELVVLQIDAHADLRDGYLGEHYSHASAMRRTLDHPNVKVVSVGIRSISRTEAEYYNANRERITIHWAKDRDRWNIDDILAPLTGRNVYVTFDVDGLDSATMPATGTPVAGGLDFWAAMQLIRAASERAFIVGADVVELSPIEGFPAYEFTAAQIALKIMNYALYKTPAPLIDC